MALEKKTIKIIAIVVTTLIVVVVLLGLLLGLLLRSDNIELQVWPRGADGSAQPLISYKSGDHDSVQPWLQRIDDFLNVYRSQNSDGRANVINCSFISPPPRDQQVCNVDLKEFYPCTAENQYNYRRAAPCVFLKLDKIGGWTPQPYNMTGDLPETMPEDLKGDIKFLVGRPDANEVWVSCEGVDSADKKSLGPVKYVPLRGLPTYYFPYTNQKGYLSPLVAVVFEKPRTGIVINVVCKAWAKNIACKDCEPSAAVRFQLRID